MTDLRAPFPAFGGKSRVAAEVWRRFGKPRNYVEPFCRSCAVLLLRPDPWEGTETVNDLDGDVCNFWRALQADPDGVAEFADWPVSELDLHARGDWLFYREGRAEWIERLRADPEFYDAKCAGWWVWGSCCWIGTAWGEMSAKHRQRPHLGDAGRGVNRKRPHLGNAGRGVNRKTQLREYLRGLAARLRGVRICCGDWSRVCGPTPTIKQGLTAVFLDPPYAVADREDVYDATEDREIANAVRQWCMECDHDNRMRIALCGYDGEHNELEARGWAVYTWKAHGGYGSQAKDGNDNARRERIWFSPSCINRPEFPLFPEPQYAEATA